MIRLLILCSLLMASACATSTQGWNTDDYTVKSGDTLFSIAWRYEIDPDDLSRWKKVHFQSKISWGALRFIDRVSKELIHDHYYLIKTFSHPHWRPYVKFRYNIFLRKK